MVRFLIKVVNLVWRDCEEIVVAKVSQTSRDNSFQSYNFEPATRERSRRGILFPFFARP
jgi:hypothetical protein